MSQGTLNSSGVNYSHIAWFSMKGLDSAHQLQGRKHMVSTPLENIVQYVSETEAKQFVSRAWTDAIRTTAISVEVKGWKLKLFPALKIESNIPPNKVSQAFDDLEELFRQACKRREDPEKAYLRILKLYPHRIIRSCEFVPLEESGNKPKHRTHRGVIPDFTDDDSPNGRSTPNLDLVSKSAAHGGKKRKLQDSERDETNGGARSQFKVPSPLNRSSSVFSPSRNAAGSSSVAVSSDVFSAPSTSTSAGPIALSSSSSSLDPASFGPMMEVLEGLRQDFKRIESKVDGMIEAGQQWGAKHSDAVREISDNLSSVVSRAKDDDAAKVEALIPIAKDDDARKVLGDPQMRAAVVSIMKRRLVWSGVSGSLDQIRNLLFGEKYQIKHCLASRGGGKSKDTSTLPMPVSPRPLIAQIYHEVILDKVPPGEFKDEEDFFKRLRGSINNHRRYMRKEKMKSKDKRKALKHRGGAGETDPLLISGDERDAGNGDDNGGGDDNGYESPPVDGAVGGEENGSRDGRHDASDIESDEGN